MVRLTDPERMVYRKQMRKIASVIHESPCRHCLNRDPDSPKGMETCQLYGRRYPMCGSDGRALRFELDPTTIEDMT